LKTQLKQESYEKHIFMVDLISLLNPLTIVLSTRGSSDIIVLFLVLLSLWLLLSNKLILSALIYGLSVHFKIYPIIYSVPICLFLNRKLGKLERSFWNPFWLITKERILFFGIAGSVFLSLLALFYYMYGWIFVYETYKYHSERVDHWHNFSFNYYFEYLNYLKLPQSSYISWTLGFLC